MEFSFASSLPSGPAPFLQESSLKDYTAEIMEELASSSPYDFIPFDLSSVQKGFMNIYLHVLESANTRSIAGAGILAAVIVYGVWKTSDGCHKHILSPTAPGSQYGYQRKSIEAVEDSPGDRTHVVTGASAASMSMYPETKVLSMYPETKDTSVCCRLLQSKSTDTEELSAMSETFHRQLNDALSKLDSVQYKLKELEKDKELLSAEIDVRKQMIQKLQGENTTEREKRQKAELKMEMMGIENSQIRQLRKEIDLKSGQVEKLETLMKEKDDMQMKLFENNLVLPRNVVEARAREFSELQNRVLQLQAEIDSSRRFRKYDMECQPCGLSKSVWLESSLRLPALHHSEVQTAAKKMRPNGTPVSLSQSYNKKLPNTKLRLAERSPKLVRKIVRSTEKASRIPRNCTSPSMLYSKCTPGGKYESNMCESKSVTNTSASSLSTPGRHADLHDTSISIHRKNIGVFSQIRALVANLRDSENNSANVALLKDLGSLLNSDRPRSHRLTNKQKPLSDEQSSVFMSASGGSDGSDIDEFGMRARHVRKTNIKKVTPMKRLSRYRRAKRRDNVVVKRKLAVQYFNGQARLVGLGETPALCSLSREGSHRSLVKHCPVTTAAKKNKSALDSRQSNMACSVSALQICDNNNGHQGDSWILIIPEGT